MSADRTLMSVIRTALSLISFGFTINSVFAKLKDKGVVSEGQSERNFGLSLVFLGIGMLAIGILYHIQFMAELRHERNKMRDEGLVFGESRFPPSLTLIVALVLLGLGVVTIVSMLIKAGPFG